MTEEKELLVEMFTRTGREKYPEYENHPCAHLCSVMGEFHNMIYRSLNSAYAWSYRVSGVEGQDLMDYTATVLKMIHLHHDWEEILIPPLSKR